MDDTISRLAVIQIIEKMRARIGHNLERAVGGAMIEILDEVGEDVGKLPSALGTDLAQLGTDCISRQAVLSLPIYNEKNLYGNIIREYVDIEDVKQLPPAQLSTNLAEVGTDAISRQQAIDAADVYMKRLCRYIGTSDDTMAYAFARGLLVGIKTDLGELPSAQPKMGKWILDRSGAYYCSECMEPCATYVMMKPRDKYCKMCGAKMEGSIYE